ncbi:DUF3999 family protein [Entomohabitans teleogrylli]|uniref:DUF3999 family protein n=1 Tax=Entomohabitans teleogrylli TaxID=1384589 RepID=UPI00073D9F04|nr:DUF3999 family protein [Entomohabitans teleogrylli]
MNVKRNSWLLLSLLCLSAVVGAQTAGDTPQDFAYGSQLITEGSAPFYRVELSARVYEQTAWPDMRDMQVFNSQGMAVPFALSPDIATEEISDTYALRVFPLDAKEDNSGEQAMISLRSASGVEVTLPADRKQPAGRNFLLEVAGEEGDYPQLSELQLEWPRLAENWQARVSVRYSDNLQDWRSLLNNAPLMDLTSGDDRLLLNTLDLHRNYLPRARYYLLTLRDDSAPAALTISTAKGIAKYSTREQRRITLQTQVKPVSSGEAEYSWPSPQVLSALNIAPAQNNTVLPLEIEYRSSAQDNWRLLTKQVVYRLDERLSGPIALGGKVVQAVRIKGVNQQWNDRPPQVSGERDVRTVVFNAQGSSPYLLVWGNRAASGQAMDIQALIPQELRASFSLVNLPDAGLQPVQVLGGPERLTATDSAEKAALWQQGLLWLVLILGAGGLVVLALKVWREVQKREQ